MSRAPLGSYIYFTPITPEAKTRMVMNVTQSLDPHYKYKHETVFISELTDRDQGIFSWSRHNSKKSTDFLKLIMKDCTEEMEVYYGNQLEIFPMKRAMVLEFSPLLGPSDTQILWRPGQTSRRWSADVVTSDQQGNYTLRGRLGVELRKIRVTVIAKTMEVSVEGEGSLIIRFPIPTSKSVISFTDQSGMEHVLYQMGIESVDVLYSLHLDGRVSLQDHPSGSSVRIEDLRPSDAGTYEVRDSHGHLVVIATLESQESPLSFLKYYIVAAVFLCLVICCCVCKCCCRRCSQSSKAAGTPKQSPGLYEVADSEGRSEVPRSSLIDAPAQNPLRLSYGVPSFSLPSLSLPPLSVSGLYEAPDVQVGGTPLYPITSNLSPSSDAAPAFQPTRGNGDSLDFLSTEVLPATVYTSEQLSFL
ncbi:uncharacterized protein LOC105906154 isoform X2 [Clupea harengus]|nr:uncharacterized protein LOC105906154 isoform X2 [Clupea harengus]